MPSHRPPRPRPTSPPSFPKPHCTLQGRTTLSAQRPPLGAVCLRADWEAQYLLTHSRLWRSVPLYEEGKSTTSCSGPQSMSTHKNGALLSQSAALLFNSVEGRISRTSFCSSELARLLLTLQAGADIMLSLLDLADDASLCAALNASGISGFAFRVRISDIVFPPSDAIG